MNHTPTTCSLRRTSACVVGVLVLSLLGPIALGQSYVGVGRAVLDGDTVQLLRDTGKIVQVELYGIDAPEIGQPYGLEAAQTLRRTILQKRVRAVAEGRGEEGRPLFLLRVDDRGVNAQLVRKGLAWWDRTQAAHEDRFRRLEQRARAAERGLWNVPNPVPPWKWRARNEGS